MLGRVRQFFREESLGITIPVGVVLGWGLYLALTQLVYGLISPHLRNVNDQTITILGIDFYFPNFLGYAVAFVVMAALAFVLFFLPLASDETTDTGMREGPECRSDIVAEATRCAFCTALVPPVASE